MDKSKENLFRAIRAIIESMPMPFDQTKVGRVIEILNNNRYKVQIQGDTYTIKSQFHFCVNERVFVTFPCGSTTDLYIKPNKQEDNVNIVVSDTEPNLADYENGDIWIKT